MLDFCYLVNPYFPSGRMVEEMKANFETLLREYPSGMEVNPCSEPSISASGRNTCA